MGSKEASPALILRLNAGVQYGYGHLSRCTHLAKEFEGYRLLYVIRTDDYSGIENYLSRNLETEQYKIVQIPEGISEDDELELIDHLVKQERAFLILDHYQASESYQYFLRNKNISWLQFDSHGRINFYADMVLHASPAATENTYKPLLKNPATKLLLGPEYIIVSDKFKEARKLVQVRRQIKKIFMCFGGGYDRGAAIKCLRLLDQQKLQHLNVSLYTNSKNPALSDIKEIANQVNNVRVLVDNSEIADGISEADLGIIAPGTLSYEAAALGLPMLLITIADNQNMNAVGWQDAGCAINLGHIEELNAEKLNSAILELIEDEHELQSMSEQCLKIVDGEGVKRIKKEIETLV